MTAETKTKNQIAPRFAALDGVRGMAIFMVMFGHLVGSMGLLGKFVFYDRVLFSTPLHFFFNETDAVLIFFVLSGFVMQLPYTKQERQIQPVAFWGMRFFRLYPSHVLCLAVCFFYHHFLYDPAAITRFNPGLHMFFDHMPNWKDFFYELNPIGPSLENSVINAPLWSLFVEFKISLLFPLIIYASRKTSFWVFVALPVFFFILFAIYPEATLKYLPMFMLGAFAAQYKDKLLSFLPEKASFQLILALLLLISFEGRFLYEGFFPGILRPLFLAAHKYSFVFGWLTSLSTAILLLLVLKDGPVKKIFSTPLLVLAGRMTLPLYLLSFATYFVCLSFFDPMFEAKRTLFAIAAPASLLITFAASYLIHFRLEMPLNQLGHRLFKKG